jgi:uncharacterized membrane protein YedE/YeeE
MYPSIMAHSLNGFLIFLAIVVAVVHISKLRNLDIYKLLVLILLFAIVVGIHGLSHLWLEKEYYYIPFNLWKIHR